MTAVKRQPEIRFVVEGTPVAWSRAGDANKDGKHWHYTPPKMREYKRLVSIRAKEAMNKAGARKPLDCPFLLGVEVFIPRPKAHYDSKGKLKDSAPAYPITKPDFGNYEKGIEDAMNNIVYTDDARLVGRLEESRKNYADHCPPQVCVRIVPLENLTVKDVK